MVSSLKKGLLLPSYNYYYNKSIHNTCCKLTENKTGKGLTFQYFIPSC